MCNNIYVIADKTRNDYSRKEENNRPFCKKKMKIIGRTKHRSQYYGV